MSKLGYIISDRKISDLRDCVGNVKDISQADLTKPILYIGYKNAKKVKGYKLMIRLSGLLKRQNHVLIMKAI